MSEAARRSGSVSLPPEFRALAALVAIDLLAGVWVQLHRERLLSILYLAQVPGVGVGGLAWGFLPDARKSQFGEWLAERLRRPGVFLGSVGVGVAALLLSAFRSTIVLSAVNPEVSSTVLLVQGRQERPDSVAVARSDSLRLNRLTTPVYHSLWIWPWGRQVWLYSRTSVSFRDWKVYPWIPLRLQYPDDFVPMAAVAVLPAPSTLMHLHDAGIRLVLRDRDGTDTVAVETLDEHGFLAAFAPPGPLPPEVRARWRQALSAIDPDTSFVNPVLRRWEAGDWIRTRRPLQKGDSLTWEIRAAAGAALASGRLGLNDAVVDLAFEF